MASQLQNGQTLEEVSATAGISIVSGQNVDGTSLQISTHLASKSVELNVGSEFDMESFIDLVRNAPCIWNTSCRSYKEHGKRRNAWNNIASFFDKDGMY